MNFYSQIQQQDREVRMCVPDANPITPTLSDIIVVNAQRHLAHARNDFMNNFKKDNHALHALVLETSDPSAEWLANNHMGPISDEQRAAFDREGILLLLQHAVEPYYTVPIAHIAAKAVEFGCEQLASEKRAPIPVADIQKQAAWQDSYDTGQTARGPYVIERLDALTETERASFFRQAYRAMANHAGNAIIDRYGINALNEALNEAWSERRHILQHGKLVERPQAE